MEVQNLDVAEYLSKDEKTILDTINKSGNKLQKQSQDSKDFLNISLSEVFKVWSIKMKDILNDLARFFKNLRNYSSYFNDIDDSGNWWNGFILILKEFLHIFIKEERSIYFGISLIIFAFLIFLIQITS